MKWVNVCDIVESLWHLFRVHFSDWAEKFLHPWHSIRSLWRRCAAEENNYMYIHVFSYADFNILNYLIHAHCARIEKSRIFKWNLSWNYFQHIFMEHLLLALSSVLDLQQLTNQRNAYHQGAFILVGRDRQKRVIYIF